MTYKKVEGHDDRIRDMANGAIINKDTSGYRDYITLRNQKIKEQERIDSIEDEISEIKSLLKELVQNINTSR